MGLSKRPTIRLFLVSCRCISTSILCRYVNKQFASANLGNWSFCWLKVGLIMRHLNLTVGWFEVDFAKCQNALQIEGGFIHIMGPAGAQAWLSPQSGPTLWIFLGLNLVTCGDTCKMVRPDSRSRWSWGLSFIELTMVNARCSRQLSFTKINTMGPWGMTFIGLWLVTRNWVPLDKIGAFESILVSKSSYNFIYHVQWINQWVWFRRHTIFLINGLLNVSFLSYVYNQHLNCCVISLMLSYLY
jgi:hypothetical protein